MNALNDNNHPPRPDQSEFADEAAFAEACLAHTKTCRALDEAGRLQRCGIGVVNPNEPVELIRGKENVEIARYSDDRGTKEGGQHTKRRGHTVNEGGETRRVQRSQDLLRRMLVNQTITEEEHGAGRSFARDFYRAQLDPRRAPDLARLSGLPRGPESDKLVDARVAIGDAMQALGGHRAPLASAAWWMLGAGLSIDAFTQQQRMSNGRAATRELARGFAIAALGVLVTHYGNSLDT